MARRPSIELSITSGFCIGSALALLVLPFRWIIAMVLAAAIHEGCHYLALRLCNVRSYGLTIGSGGTFLETEPISLQREILCALAGPAGSLLLLLLIRWMPVLALCGAVQGVYNLIPVYPSDGGRALSCLLRLICPKRADSMMQSIRKVAASLLILTGCYGFFVLRLGWGVLFLTFLLLTRILPGKTPCKAP